MKKLTLIISACLMLSVTYSISALACGPTPQKVVKDIVIKADAATVWQLVKQFDAIAQWHPDVKMSGLLQKLDEDGASATFRLITLKNGLKIEEKRRETPDLEMKLDVQMPQGDFPVSNYRGVMQVKASAIAGESIVTWTGRFNNKANTLAALAGQDNAAALSAVNAFYENGLAGLKVFIESVAK